jgi:hypothetical protein
MCSIEEAWAGQNFDGKRVVSQGDLHNNYMSLPDNILNRNNDLTIKKTNQAPSQNLPRGVNSKYSREPRVHKTERNTNNASINISSEMPEINNYGGLEPLPSFMSIYNNSNQSKFKNVNENQSNTNHSYKMSQMSMPMPVMTGEQFTDIENAYTVSDTLNNYMNSDTNLLDEDTDDERLIINNKFTNMNKNKNNNKNNSFQNVNNNSNQKHNSNTTIYNDPELKHLLNTIIKKIDTIELQLSNYNNKNIYDLILYIVIGILLSFCIYSMFNKKNK